MRWRGFSLSSLFSRRGTSSNRRRTSLTIETLESRLAPTVDILTYHNDIASTGVNPNEVQLTPSNVRVGTFGKLFTTVVDGFVYAEPLVYTGVNITSGVNTSAGASGVHDVVFVATEHNSLYAIDASGSGGNVLWKRSFLGTTNTGGNINNTLGASSISPVPAVDVVAEDLVPEIGITGTPVIDPATNLLYLVTKTKEIIGSETHYVQRLHAINVNDGTDGGTPALIGDKGPGAPNTPIYVYGSGHGAERDPYNGTGRDVVQFEALRQHQRGALSLVNNQVYVHFASHADNGPYHGMVVTWDVANVKTTGFQLKGVFNTSPNDGLSGIWMGGGRLSFESDGSAFYFETGNGIGGPPVVNASGFPVDGNYNNSLLKVVADPTTTPQNQNINGWGLKVVDYFTPYNTNALDQADSDFGSGAPLVLPDSAGIPGHPHLLLASGKEGKIYLVDRDNMGKFNANNDQVINSVPNGSGHNTPPVLLNGSLSTPAYFNGKIYWIGGYSGPVNAFSINSNGSLTSTSQSANSNFGYLPGSVAVSANGTTNGIVWAMDRNANQMHAYDATSLSTELYHTGQKVGGGDNLGAVVKFAIPTVANGKVYVGTTNSLVVYGLTPPSSTVPNAPVLSATALSGTSVNLTWTDSTQAPQTASGYKIERSTDNVNFTQITTAPAGATSIALGSLTPNTLYYFRIRGFNGVGDSPYSNTATATTNNQAVLLDFSAGFAGSTSTLKYNGSAIINGSKAELTNNYTQAGSVFSLAKVDITQFTSQFTFQLSAGPNTADGFTFTMQGNAATSLGLNGGGLGYGPDFSGGTGGIPKSVAIKFDIYSNAGEGANSTGMYLNGVAPTNAGSINLTTPGINFHSGNVFRVNLSYNGTTLTVTITDTVANKTATQNYTVNIPTVVGGSTAFVGFTGGTGGISAIQDILTWTYSPPQAVSSPNAPSGLGATTASATSVFLNWTNNATNQTGFHLDRATDPGFTFNLITLNLPATPNTYTDTATGLAPGGTFYYRLRSFNSAGDSGNSNIANVAIPLAPPKPSDQQVESVTTTTVDLSWQDNAGHAADGYRIIRATNHGTFSEVATLPPTSRTPPSIYEWTDETATPGNYYEYHIIAFNVSGFNDFAGANAFTLTNAPGGVLATAGNAVINLSWAATTGAVSYNIYRGTASGGETLLATAVTGTTFADTAVTNGTKYYYFITALNGNSTFVPPIPSESAASQEVSATAVLPTPPSAPSGLGATATSATSVLLNWTNNATNQTGFHLDRATDVGFSANLITLNLPASPNSYTDTTAGLAPGGTYYYRLRAFNAVGDSSDSLPANVVIPLAPALPTNAVVRNVTTNSIAISWQDNAGTVAAGYQILRAINQGAFSQIALLPPTLLAPPSAYSWTDTNLTPGTLYSYRVIASNISGNSGFAGMSASTITLAANGLTANPGNGVVNLSWTAATGAASYKIYRGLASGAETILTSGVTATSFSDNTVTNGTKYYYFVSAVNANTTIVPAIPSESAPSLEAFATPVLITPPPAPTGLLVAGTPPNLGTARLSLTWNAVAGATSYKVYRSLTSNGQGSTPLTTVTGASTYLDNAVTFGTTYFYKVTAVNGGGEGTLSAEASGTPLLTVSVNYTSNAAETPAGYLSDTGLAYGARSNGLTYGWNISNTANMLNRNSASSPSELHDSLGQMQRPSNSNAWWGMAVPNGTYTVQVIAGDPTAFNSVYKITVGATLNGSTFSGGTLAINGTPTTSNRWITNTVNVVVTNGILYVSNATGANNNKIDAIVVTQVLPGSVPPQFTGPTGPMTLNGSAQYSGTKLRLTSGNAHDAGSAFTATKIGVSKFNTQFNFQVTNPVGDGFTFVLQNNTPNSLGIEGEGLGFMGINKSVAVKFDFYNNNGEGANSTGMFRNGVNPTLGGINLGGSNLDFRNGHVFNASITYDGITLRVTITDTTTLVSATQTYAVDIAGTLGGTTGYVGFTGGSGSATAIQDILSWTYTPIP